MKLRSFFLVATCVLAIFGVAVGVSIVLIPADHPQAPSEDSEVLEMAINSQPSAHAFFEKDRTAPYAERVAVYELRHRQSCKVTYYFYDDTEIGLRVFKEWCDAPQNRERVELGPFLDQLKQLREEGRRAARVREPKLFDPE